MAIGGMYLRRSAARRQADRNASRAEQRAEILDRAEEDGVPIERVYDEGDGRSASRHARRGRPQWDAAISALRSGEIDTLYVYEMSRADRAGVFGTVIGELVEGRIPGRIVVVSDDLDTSREADRPRIINALESARDETERLSKRVRRTKRRRAAEGMWLGGHPPFGMAAERDADGQPTGRLIRSPDWGQARAIAERLLAGESIRSVCRDVGWSPSRMSGWVHTPTIAGVNSAGVPYLGGEDARVVTPGEQARIVMHLGRRISMRPDRDGGVRRGGSPESWTLLGGRDGALRCGVCHGPMVGLSRKPYRERNGRTRRPRYQCRASRNGHCPGSYAPMEAADRFVLDLVFSAATAAPDGHPVRAKVAEAVARLRNPDQEARERAAVEALDRARARLKRAQEGYLDGLVEAEDVRAAKAAVEAAERALATAGAGADDDWARSLADIIDGMPLTDRRALIRAVLPEGVILARRLSGMPRQAMAKVPIEERLIIPGGPVRVGAVAFG